jgi:hypothetical protein
LRSALDQCSATFLFHPWHTLIWQTHDGTPQNVALRKGGTIPIPIHDHKYVSAYNASL